MPCARLDLLDSKHYGNVQSTEQTGQTFLTRNVTEICKALNRYVELFVSTKHLTPLPGPVLMRQTPFNRADEPLSQSKSIVLIKH